MCTELWLKDKNPDKMIFLIGGEDKLNFVFVRLTNSHKGG